MKRILNETMNSGRWAVLLLVLLAAFGVAACQDDEDGGGMPVIHYVRVTDPALADSTFTDAYPGTMIAIIGENLGGVKELYINNYQVSFNPTYNTSTCIIVTIPSVDEDNPDLFQLVGTNPDLPSEIRVVTNHGTATYAFHILSPAPYITRLAADYPVVSGEDITIVGANFYEIQQIYFSEDSISVTQEVTDYTVNADYDEITFTAPSNLIDEGYLFVVCYTDTASTEFLRNGPKPVVTDISSRMPVVGSQVRISGQNFISVEEIDVNGEFTIPGEDIEVSEEFDELTFIMPQAPTASGTLTVITASGSDELPGTFYPIENVILNYDGIGSYNWGGYAGPTTTDGSAAPYVADGVFSSIVGEISAWNYWWGQSVNNTQWPSSDVLPGSTSIADLELQYECYIEQAYTGPVIQVVLGDNWDYNLTNYVPLSDYTGEMEVGHWTQYSIPLTDLVTESTWQAFLDSGKLAMLGFYITNPTAEAAYVGFYIDNVRIVRIDDSEEEE